MNIKLITLLLMINLSCLAQATPVTFSVDPEHSLPRFSFNHLGLSTVVGRFDKMSGEIILDAEKQTGSIDVIIDISSLSTGVEVLDEHLISGDFFNASKYPTATFKSTMITFDSGRPVSISGNLTLHGVTQSVTFIVTAFKRGPHLMKQNRESIGGNATAMVSRSAFGLGRFTPNVGDGVTISLGLEAIRN